MLKFKIADQYGGPIIQKLKNDVKLRFSDLKKPQNIIIGDIQIIYLDLK